MAYVIAEPCINVKDKACVEVCPVDCIYEGKDMLYIHPDECIDCGACEPVCPVKAIFAEDEVPVGKRGALGHWHVNANWIPELRDDPDADFGRRAGNALQ